MRKIPNKVSAIILTSLIIAVFCIHLFWRKLALIEWDLILSGVILFIIGILLLKGIRRKMEDTLTRLLHRGVIRITEEELQELKIYLETKAKVWAKRTGLFVSIVILIAFIVAGLFPSHILQKPLTFIDALAHIPLTLFDLYAGFIGGCFFGRMALYGTLGRILKNKGISLKIQPGHLDKVAGLQPIGNFYFFQALIVSFPALFLSFWLVVMIFQPEGAYLAWQKPYVVLLPMAMAFEILAFLIPIWSFHSVMQREKRILLEKADKLSLSIVQIQAKLADPVDSKQYEVLSEQLSHKTKIYRDIVKMPTWPVDVRIQLRFSLSNLALSIPLVSSFINKESFWYKVVKSLEDFLTSINQ
jgi:hypothetical protein